MQRLRIEGIVLDAMGVLYDRGDDVADLLIPYLRSKGCTRTDDDIAHYYRECSLGKLTSEEFWIEAGAVGAHDKEYCQSHRLTDGVLPLLGELKAAGYRLGCLTNDVSEWADLLRARFGLDECIPDWIVSGDYGFRKPRPEAFDVMCSALATPPSRVLFVDDRKENVVAAEMAGMHGIQYGTPGMSTMDELGQVLRDRFTPW